MNALRFRLLRRLVGFNTESSRSNLPLIHFVADFLRGLGARPQLVPDSTGEKAGLFCAVGGDAKKAGVALSAHTDVVPAKESGWRSPPFSLTARGGRLYGRGASDMKGFVALAMEAAANAARRPKLRAPLIIAFSRDEEIGCLGAPPLIAAMKRKLPMPKFAIIGEPTGLCPAMAHKGKLIFRADIQGMSGHSAQPSRAVNAAVAAAEMAAAFSRPAPRARVDARFSEPRTTVNIAALAAASAAENIIPDRAHLVAEIRNLPQESARARFAALQAAAAPIIAKMKKKSPKCGARFQVLDEYPGLLPRPQSAAMRAARALLPGAPVCCPDYGTEAGYFQRAGIASVVCGPGDIGRAHRANEYITAREMNDGAAFLSRLLDMMEGWG